MKLNIEIEKIEKIMRNKLTWEEIVKRGNNIHSNKYIYNLQIYKNGLSKIKIECPDHGIFLQSIESHLQGRGCPKCARNIPYTVDTLKEKLFTLYEDKYIYNLSNFKNNESKIDIICDIHGAFSMKVSNHLYGQECKFCSCCVYSNSKFIEICKLKHNNYYAYNKVDYKNQKSNILITCPKHGEFIQNARSHLRGHGCISCNSSKGERDIGIFLNELHIDYEKQKKFKNCKFKKSLIFDFYLPDYRVCIEYDGKQHFSPINFFGGEKSFRYQKIRDNIKSDFCKKENYYLLRIPFYEVNIKEKITHYLNEI